MAKEKEPSFSLKSIDDIFSTQEMRDDEKLAKIRDIPLDEIDPFPKHPFKVRDDEDMQELVMSIKERGVLTPATVRQKEDGRYELISGHRRKRACELAGLETLRAEVVELDRDEATILMVESNLQRTEILPSEKAFSYKMRLDAMKRKAGRPSKENSAPVGQNFSRQELAAISTDSSTQIQRYIRLTNLHPFMLQLVDDKVVAMRPAVELSYLPKDLQSELLDYMEMEDCTPSHDQALRMRRLYEEGKLDSDSMCEIMQEEKPNQREKIIIRQDQINRLIPKNVDITQREKYVIHALEFYAKHRQRDMDMER